MFATADSQGDQAGGQNQQQHNQMELLLIQQAALNDGKYGH